MIKATKYFLSNNFEMEDLGEADVILNIKLLREGKGGITLVQSHYVEKVLSRFGFSECEPTPVLRLVLRFVLPPRPPEGGKKEKAFSECDAGDGGEGRLSIIA